MKKFLFNIPLQGTLSGFLYQAQGNQALQMDIPTAFPIMTTIHGYAKADETIAIIAVLEENNEAVSRNYQAFQTELAALCATIGCDYTLTPVMIPSDQGVKEQSQTFQKLMHLMEDNDQIYLCTTYGTKPQSTVLTMAAQYGYRVRKNVIIDCVVYGQIDRTQTPFQGLVYDMTALVRLDEVVRLLADQKVENPATMIDHLLAL